MVHRWFWCKNGHSIKPFFLRNIGKENAFYDILQRENSFLGYKNKKFKKSKSWHFYKGVNPWFWSKNDHFILIFFFKQYRQGKCLLRYFTTKKLLSRQWKCLSRYSRTKNALLGYENKKFKTSKTWHFSKAVNRWFWSKNGHSFKPFFLGNIGKDNVFYDILQRENSFLGYRNKKFKMSNNSHFSKGVNPWFRSKNGHFSKLFFLVNIGQKNVFYDILKQKKILSRL